MRTKKVLSVVLAVLICLTALIIPISSTALSKSSYELPVNWQLGRYHADTGAFETGSESYGYCICSDDYIDITGMDKVRVAYNGSNYNWNVHYYDEDKEFISSAYGQFAYASSTDKTLDVVDNASYITVSVYKNPITVAEGDIFTVEGSFELNPALIDGTKKGELAIFKYEMEDTSTAVTVGTGTYDDESDLPLTATPINDVTFKITKVVDLDSSNYYKYDGPDMPTVAEAKSMVTNTSYTQTQTTRKLGSNNGCAWFENLPLGIYLVQETDAPPHVTKSADFLVSLPYVSSDGQHWEYFAAIYPKNQSSYADVALKKVDAADNTILSGADFNVSENETEDGTYTQISTATTDSNGTATLSHLKVNHYYKLTETTAPSKYVLDNANNNNDTYFYLDEKGNVLSKDKKTVISEPDTTNNTPATITVKNTKPTIEKFIDKSRGNGTDLVSSKDSIKRYDDNNNYQYYMVQVATPNISSAMSTLKTFKVTDSFLVVKGNVCVPQIYKITYGDDAVAANANVLSTDAYTFTVKQNSTTNTTYDTTLTFDTSKIQKNTNYYIYYKTYVMWGTNNKANLTYSTVTSGTDETQTIESNTVYYINGSYKFQKTDQNGTALQGAQFQLFASEADALAKKNPVYVSTDGSGGGLTYTLTSNSSGTVVFYNVDIGTGDSIGPKEYWLVETKAPNGYNLLAAPERITVGGGYANSFQMKVVNTPKYVFPLTGGQGILIIVVVGIVFIGGAVSLLIVKKKKNKKGEMKREVK